MRRNPLIPVALALMVGIAGQHSLVDLPSSFWWILAAVGALAASTFTIVRRRPHIAFTLLCVLLFVAGIGGTVGRMSDPRYNQRDWSHIVAPETVGQNKTNNPRKVFLSARLTETPQPRKRSWRARAKVENVDGKHSEGDILLYFKKDSTATTLRYGDRLLIHGYPNLEKRTLYTTSDHYLITAHDDRSLRAHAEHLRMRLLHRMQQGPLDKRQAGVAEALTLGWRADIDPKTQEAYRDAGISHLLAVSGLHVGLVALAVGILLSFIPKTRKGRITKGAIQLAAVWLFALITGMSPSTMRAALMFSLFIVSDIFERGTPKLNLMAATAILTLTIKPMLLFDIGWQLSYSAVAGILLARPLITLYHNRLWQASLVSIIATIATMPIILTTFHRIQPYFLIANVVIIPLAGVILVLALAYMAIPCTAAALPLGKMLEWSGWLTEQVSGLPGAVIETGALNGWTTAILAIVVATMLIALNLTMRKVSEQVG